MYSFEATRRLFRFFGYAAMSGSGFGTTELDLTGSALKAGVQGDPILTLADLKEIFGTVRCDTAGKLEVYQGFRDANGAPVWTTRTEVAVTASTFSASNFSVDGDGVGFGPIPVVGEICRFGFKTNSGNTKNFQLNVSGR